MRWEREMDLMQDQITDLWEMLSDIVDLWEQEADKSQMENAMSRAAKLLKEIE